MKALRVAVRVTGVLAVVGASSYAKTSNAATWGGFDTTRVNYPEGVLTGTAHTMLRGIITASGDTIGPLTPTITPAYLSGIDVFYTSLLTNNDVPLSASEQAALQAWVAGGGKLIVTADVFNLPGYTSFTSFVGVTNYATSNNYTVTTTGTHPLVMGVTTIDGTTASTFTYGANTTLLANNSGSPYAVVLDDLTGYTGGGCILVFGDHNEFTDSYIATADNTKMANNFVAWTRTCNAKMNGGTCTSPSQCASGFCVDGFCCDKACGGGTANRCQACSVAAGATTNGVCATLAAQTVCRPAMGACDSAEVCDGTAVTCPADAFKPMGTVCHQATDLCDLTELCDGMHDACPPSAVAPAGTTCRAAAGQCDVAAACDGSLTTCPPNALKADGTPCDDGNPNTVNDVCKSGTCAGVVPMTTSSAASTGSSSAASTGSSAASTGSGNATSTGAGAGGMGTTSGAGGGSTAGTPKGCACHVDGSSSRDVDSAWMLIAGAAIGLGVSRRSRHR